MDSPSIVWRLYVMIQYLEYIALACTFLSLYKIRHAVHYAIIMLIFFISLQKRGQLIMSRSSVRKQVVIKHHLQQLITYRCRVWCLLHNNFIAISVYRCFCKPQMLAKSLFFFEVVWRIACRKQGRLVVWTQQDSSSFFYALVIFCPRGFLIFLKLQFSLRLYIWLIYNLYQLYKDFQYVLQLACLYDIFAVLFINYHYILSNCFLFMVCVFCIVWFMQAELYIHPIVCLYLPCLRIIWIASHTWREGVAQDFVSGAFWVVMRHRLSRYEINQSGLGLIRIWASP